MELRAPAQLVRANRISGAMRASAPLIRIALAVGALVAASCGGANRYADDIDNDIVGTFSESGSLDVPDEWWTAFDDPALNTLIEQGLDGSLTLDVAWLRIAQAETVMDRETSSLFPSIEADASVSQGFGPPPQNGFRTSFGVSARYEIDVWGRVSAGLEALEQDIVARTHDLEAAGISLTAQIATAWYQLVQLRGQLELIDSQRELNATFLELVELRFGLGLVDAQDVLRQQRLLETSQSDIAALNADIEVLEHRIAFLLGQPPGAVNIPGNAELLEPPVLPDTGVPSDLLQRRPDVLAALARVEAADARTAVAARNRFPRINLSASISTSGDPGGIFTDWIGNLIAGITAPLFDGGQREAELERNELVAEEALTNYGQVVLTALTEVEDALSRNRWQTERITSLEAQLDLAMASYERARTRYANGTTTFLTVLDATTTYQQLERSLLSARGSLIQHRIDLCRALAGSWNLADDMATENE